ncbi:Protein TIC 21, chloroplastic [Capsicum baccatum]|uniref:Protein TIC 21, chloroplastic n=1 Tax=Capsicum baccatum TaxID=33114 RepID=A0A2G2XBJ9_CAPBA|nr:Protein TIC 21, chloroplastic [Capsicum baccatum]
MMKISAFYGQRDAKGSFTKEGKQRLDAYGLKVTHGKLVPGKNSISKDLGISSNLVGLGKECIDILGIVRLTPLNIQGGFLYVHSISALKSHSQDNHYFSRCRTRVFLDSCSLQKGVGRYSLFLNLWGVIWRVGFWSFGFLHLSERLKKTTNEPSKVPPRSDVVKILKNGIVVNLLGMGAAVLGMH